MHEILSDYQSKSVSRRTAEDLRRTVVCKNNLKCAAGGLDAALAAEMDGGRICRSVARIFTTRAKATYAAMVVGRVFAVLLALRGLHSIFTRGPWGFISILIAWMIWREGWREYVMAVQEERWGSPWEYSARVSPPPYSDDGDDEVEVRRRRDD